MGSKPKRGRPKGSPNKQKASISERAEALGIDPFEVLLLFAAGDWKTLGYHSEQYVKTANECGTFYSYTIDPSVRAKCAAEACQYLHPKKKAVELSGSLDVFDGLTDDQLRDRIEAEWERQRKKGG